MESNESTSISDLLAQVTPEARLQSGVDYVLTAYQTYAPVEVTPYLKVAQELGLDPRTLYENGVALRQQVHPDWPPAISYEEVKADLDDTLRSMGRENEIQ